MLKKIIFTILFLFICFISIAQLKISAELDAVEYQQGNLIRVRLHIMDNPGLHNILFFLEYDGDETEHRNNLDRYVSSDVRLMSNTAKTIVLEVMPVKNEWLGDKKILVDCIVRVVCTEKVNTQSPSPKPTASSKQAKSI